jgi:hypothetical protein
MTQVPATATPLTRDATAALLVPAYVEVFGELPDRNRAELLLALIWIENANGQAFIQRNWGNLSTKPSAGVDYWRPSWFDLAQVEAMPDGAKKARLLDLHARMLAKKAPEAFRAFASHPEGLRAWLRLLKSPGMRPLLEAASSGDAVAFAHAVFSTRYCPDPECRAAGPSYARQRDLIHSAGYFEGLKKKSVPVAQDLALSFFFLGRRLAARTSGSEFGDARAPSGIGDA